MNISDIRVLPTNVESEFDRSSVTVISGGQNGVDQAALSAAKSKSIKTGGWAAKGWMTLDGPMKSLLVAYGLIECEKDGYRERTFRNVRDSDVTVRIAANLASPGEKCTKKAISHYGKPHVDLRAPIDLTDENAEKLASMIRSNGWTTVNVAGNSERTCLGIGKEVGDFLEKCFGLL